MVYKNTTKHQMFRDIRHKSICTGVNEDLKRRIIILFTNQSQIAYL